MIRFAATDDYSPLSTVIAISPSPSPSQTFTPLSPTPVNEMVKNPVQIVPFSSSTIKTDKTEVVFPSDNFAKRKRNAMDGLVGETLKMMDRMASSVETVVKPTNQNIITSRK